MKFKVNIFDFIKRGLPNGVAGLDDDGKVPSSQLPATSGNGNVDLTDYYAKTEISPFTLNNCVGGFYKFSGSDPNRPVADDSNDQSVFVLKHGNVGMANVNIAIITTQRIDFAGRWWVTTRWSNNAYATPVEITDSTYISYLQSILNEYKGGFTRLAETSSMTVERSQDCSCNYDWNSSNRPYSGTGGYRQFWFMIIVNPLINTTWTAREVIIIGAGSSGYSSWTGPHWVRLQRKPAGSTTWDTMVQLV